MPQILCFLLYRHIFINPQNGLEYGKNTFDQSVMDNPSVPIMTHHDGILTVNNMHIQLLNILHNTSMVRRLPELLPYEALR